MAAVRLRVAERRALAADPATDPAQLAQLARDSDEGVRRSVAGNPNVSIGTAAYLVTSFPDEVAENPSLPFWELTGGDTDQERAELQGILATILPRLTDPERVAAYEHSRERTVRQGVAVNKVTPAPVLARLARDPSPFVRETVARNRHTPAQALVSLLDDRHEGVVMHAAANPNLPAEWVEPLADDKRFNVRMMALGNPTMPVAQMRRFADDANGRLWVAGNEGAPADLLALLATADDNQVRKNVAENEATPREALGLLCSDPDAFVRQTAQQVWEYRFGAPWPEGS